MLTKRMFDDDEMVLGKWMASMAKILLYDHHVARDFIVDCASEVTLAHTAAVGTRQT